MLRWLIIAYDEWRAPMLEAEKLVVEQDHAALSHVAALAAAPNQTYDVRRSNARVLRIAIERKKLSRGVDTGTQYCLHEHWRSGADR